MYYLYIDESGVEGITEDPTKRGLDHDWFTSGGIIVNEEGKRAFHDAHNCIIEQFFDKKGITLPPDFKLHYRELRQEVWPYNQFTREELGQMANAVFNAINSIDCKLVSASINKLSHKRKYPSWAVNVRAYSLLLSLERFQYFLEEYDEEGIGVYEKLTNSIRRNIGRDLRRLLQIPTFPYFTNLANINKKIINGDPVQEKVLQFSDFFVYAPHIRLVNNYRTGRRWLEIKDKYYNFTGKWNQCGYVAFT